MSLQTGTNIVPPDTRSGTDEEEELSDSYDDDFGGIETSEESKVRMRTVQS